MARNTGGKRGDSGGSPRSKSLSAWKQRVSDAEDLHDSWESTFKCRELHSKYVGTHQWLEEEDPEGDRYYVNLYFSGVETRKPGLVFTVPRFKVEPRPTRTDDQFSPSDYRARLFQDSINTVAKDRRVGFLREALLALQESFFRFGAVEVGIRGDVVDNPRAGRPMLKDDMDAWEDDKGNSVVEPDRLVREEIPYVKRIPASNVLISSSNKNGLDHNDWVGYYDYVRLEDIDANPFYDKKAKKSVRSSFDQDWANRSGYATSTSMPRDAHQYVKLYRVWDMRDNVKLVFSEHGDDFLLKEKYRVLPLRVLKFHEILDSFYPVPPTYNWLPQQRELNETREMQRNHRRRFLRKYTIITGAIDPRSLDKLESGEDGVYVEVNRHDDIQPLPDADLGRTFHLQLPATMQDFMMVSGVTGERQGIQEAETATQASIIDANAKLRDLYAKQVVRQWISDIAYTLLLVMAEQASLPFWVNLNVDRTSIGAPDEAQDISVAWRLIQATEYSVDEILNYEMDLELDTLSPSADERDAQKWLQTLSIIVDPITSLHLLASDVMLRKTLRYQGITSEKEVMEIKASMGKVQLFMIQRQALAAQGILAPPPFDMSQSGKSTPTGVPRGGIPAPGQPGPGTTPALPSPQNTETQLAGQIPGGNP